jgi:CBS domain containing-hemolysin-like protein
LLFSLAFAPFTAQASFFHGEALDKMADILTWVVICIVPVTVIAVFWLVHILPEKIAEKRHHPQKTAIKTLCLLSLVFGGMLWPLAWLWAYMKPVGYKLAYGTDKHEDYFKESAEHAEKGEIAQSELEAIRQELDGLAARGQLTPELRSVLQRLSRLPAETPPESRQENNAFVPAQSSASMGKAD